MQLITGPAGSGKTAFVLERFREALRSGDSAVRLLVPTSTMALHLQNQIAREGFVFRRGLIQTLSGFVETRVADFPQVPDSVLYLVVEEAVARVNRREFRKVAAMPGFSAALARTVAEFSSAGCDSARLAACLPDAPLAEAFLAVYKEVDRGLDRRGLLLRAQRLECAAARIQSEGLPGIATIWLDGFHALPDPELTVIAALCRHARVTLTLADGDATRDLRGRLLAMGFQEEKLAKRRGAPAVALVKASGIEREVEEIARRICEQAGAGRPFREMGIIVRSADTYVPLLRTTLERFGIPARFYFDEDAQTHPAVRYLCGMIDAMLGGWDHAATLGVLRLAPRFADSPALDKLDFAVREQIPNAGLGALKALVTEPESPLEKLIDSFAALEEWRSFELQPANWVARFRTLRNWYRVPLTGQVGDLTHAGALDLFDEALGEAAKVLDGARLFSVTDFWRAVKSVLRIKPLRLSDHRRNVVHVLSAHEARQWVLPVMFVCGLVEKQFPQFHPQDPFFPDTARAALNRAGIRVRTAAEFEREERALFDSALTRASMLVTLSYPEFGVRGDRNLPSLFLEDLALVPSEARPARPEPQAIPLPPRPPAIRTPSLLAALAEKTGRLSPTGLDSYQQCPFQFFTRRTLRLETTPPRPEDRLDFQVQGMIVHDVLRQWYSDRQDIAALFERIFESCCQENRIQPGYHTERLRNTMLEDLKRFAADEQWPRFGFETRTEEAFTLPLDGVVEIGGRIDRIDTAAGNRTYILDYKYSAALRIKEKKEGTRLQAPLYVLAAEHSLGKRPVGMFFIGLKGGVAYSGWSDDGLLDAEPLPENWSAETRERTLALVSEIRSGRILPLPADADGCRFCEARDVCRIEITAPVAVTESV